MNPLLRHKIQYSKSYYRLRLKEEAIYQISPYFFISFYNIYFLTIVPSLFVYLKVTHKIQKIIYIKENFFAYLVHLLFKKI